MEKNIEERATIDKMKSKEYIFIFTNIFFSKKDVECKIKTRRKEKANIVGHCHALVCFFSD